MLLKRFTIITRNDSLQIDEETPIVINLDHLISVKPIKISTENRDVIEGHWVRLSNGKKYRAIQVPDIVLDAFSEELAAVQKNTETDSELTIQ